MTAIDFASRVHGCLLGGALGDAFGFVLEDDDGGGLRGRVGAKGLLDLSEAGRSARISDGTQLTLYTVDALVEALEWANSGVAADETACLWLAYLRWLATQQPLPDNAPPAQPRWIDGQSVLRHRRNPGKATLSALASGTMGTMGRPLNPQARGCGALVRSAPFGLVPFISVDAVYTMSVNGAALTHGHPSAQQTSGAFSVLVRALLDGAATADAARVALAKVQRHPTPSSELVQALSTALDLAAATPDGPAPAQVAVLGSGKLASEALALAVYCVLSTAGGAFSPVDHFLSAVRAAANSSADSASTASLAGSILGACYGEECLPKAWLTILQAPSVVRTMADSLLAVTSGS